MKDPEKSRAARSRESYMKDPEKSAVDSTQSWESYMKDPEKSRADSAESYMKDPEKNADDSTARSRESYKRRVALTVVHGLKQVMIRTSKQVAFIKDKGM